MAHHPPIPLKSYTYNIFPSVRKSSTRLSRNIHTASLKGSFGKLEPGICEGRLGKFDLDRSGRVVSFECICRGAELHLHLVSTLQQIDCCSKETGNRAKWSDNLSEGYVKSSPIFENQGISACFMVSHVPGISRRCTI